jgi:hypothetical protein
MLYIGRLERSHMTFAAVKLGVYSEEDREIG